MIFRLGPQSLTPLDLAGAQRRYLAALLGDKKRCEHCGSFEGVEFESGRTAYEFDGVQGSPEDPNRDRLYYRQCAVEHHAYWDECWADYRTSVRG